jgi:hypothetical protein
MRDPTLRAHAQRIRALPPLLGPDTDAVAHAEVSAALRARALLDAERREARTGRVASPSAAPSGALRDVEAMGDPAHAATASLRDSDLAARGDFAEALAEYADSYASVFRVSPLEADAAAVAAADASDAAEVLAEAIARGAERETLVRMGLRLVQDMADAARRRERLPTPSLRPLPEAREGPR